MRLLLVGALAVGLASPLSPPARSATQHLTLVALGDSLPYGRDDCGFCATFPELFGKAIATHMHITVTTRNLSEHTGIASGDLRAELQSSTRLRSAVAGAGVITLTIGHNDPPWNSEDDSCDGKGGYPNANWSKYDQTCLDATAAQYRQNFISILKSIRTLRAQKRTMLRVTNDYNDLIGDPQVPASADAIAKPFFDTLSILTCRLAKQYGGACVDTYHAFNGPSGTRDAGTLLARDHTHPNAKGHKLIAALLVRAGYGPLFR
jgi:lysophospholipase L1-like esterase